MAVARHQESRRSGRHCRSRLFACAFAASASLLAAPAPAADDPSPAVDERSRVQLLVVEEARTRAELDALGSAITVTGETIARLDAEIRALAQDRAAIRRQMIETAEEQRRIGVSIAASEHRIVELEGEQAELRLSLRERHGVLAEVLGALQRMGREPPPALLVHPDDALGSVRSAILLGSVVPAIREERDKLAFELAALSRLREETDVERSGFAEALGRQREEEARLARLFAEKERLEAGSREALDASNRRAAELAADASDLQGLIAALEGDLEDAREAEEAARRAAEAERAARVAAAEALAEEERLRAEREMADRGPAQEPEVEVAALPPEGEPAEPAYDIASLRREMASLEPVAAFSTIAGTLTPPVTGAPRHGFGKDDGFGRRSSGMTFGSRSGELVTAPADGRVLYSGPFRSYGQLLILNVGDGYHVVLAGMGEIDVDVGQFVLAGEPVAVMGARRLASAESSDVVQSTQPSLYVEFRKDGKPVDPAPWWADGSSGRTRNDS